MQKYYIGWALACQSPNFDPQISQKYHNSVKNGPEIGLNYTNIYSFAYGLKIYFRPHIIFPHILFSSPLLEVVHARSHHQIFIIQISLKNIVKYSHFLRNRKNYLQENLNLRK